MSDAVIALDKLSKSVPVGFWGRRVGLLHDVTFEVKRGATVGFVGANGAGKSTTIKHIIGGARPTSGAVHVLGGDPREPSVRARFGYMPELPNLPPTLTPVEMMRLHATLYGLADPSSAITRLLETVGLGDRGKQRVGTFSKGQQTRLTLALSLLHDPELLILDEPMSGLDPVGRQLVRGILRDEAARGRTILFSSHVLADVESLCDEVVVIERGRVVYAGTATDAVGPETGAWSVRVRTKDGQPPPGVREARREGDTLVLVVDGTDAADIAVRLRDAGATVVSLEPLRRSLEERLLSWIGKSAS
jgi:ABC-2 type transport system ATP-binding protein